MRCVQITVLISILAATLAPAPASAVAPSPGSEPGREMATPHRRRQTTPRRDLRDFFRNNPAFRHGVVRHGARFAGLSAVGLGLAGAFIAGTVKVVELTSVAVLAPAVGALAGAAVFLAVGNHLWKRLDHRLDRARAGRPEGTADPSTRGQGVLGRLGAGLYDRLSPNRPFGVVSGLAAPERPGMLSSIARRLTPRSATLGAGGATLGAVLGGLGGMWLSGIGGYALSAVFLPFGAYVAGFAGAAFGVGATALWYLADKKVQKASNGQQRTAPHDPAVRDPAAHDLATHDPAAHNPAVGPATTPPQRTDRRDDDTRANRRQNEEDDLLAAGTLAGAMADGSN